MVTRSWFYCISGSLLLSLVKLGNANTSRARWSHIVVQASAWLLCLLFLFLSRVSLWPLSGLQGPVLRNEFNMSWISLHYPALLNQTKAIQLSAHTKQVINLVSQLRFSSFTHEDVHIKEAGFATYDQSQTWTEQLLTAEWHVLNVRSKIIIETKSNFSRQTQEDQGKKSTTVWMRKAL